MDEKTMDELIYMAGVLEDEATNMQLDASKLKMRLETIKSKLK